MFRRTKKDVYKRQLERYFKKSELIPCIVQEASTNEVLMLAYMNRESMAKTLETGYTWLDVYKRQAFRSVP